MVVVVAQDTNSACFYAGKEIEESAPEMLARGRDGVEQLNETEVGDSIEEEYIYVKVFGRLATKRQEGTH